MLDSIFNPSPSAAAAVLADLDDCSLSFHDLAKKHGTNSEALALWLSTDEITQRIQVTANVMARRVRSAATSRLPIAARAVCHIVESYDGARDLEQPPLELASPTSLAELERRRRRDDSTRRACYLLLRLATFFFATKPPPQRDHPPGRRAEDPPSRKELHQQLPDLRELAASCHAGFQPAPIPASLSNPSSTSPQSPTPTNGTPSSSSAPSTSSAFNSSSISPPRPPSPSASPAISSFTPPTFTRPRQRFKRRRQLSG